MLTDQEREEIAPLVTAAMFDEYGRAPKGRVSLDELTFALVLARSATQARRGILTVAGALRLMEEARRDLSEYGRTLS